MPEEPLNLAIIVGSVREGRFGPVVAGWFAECARRRADLRVDLIDLAETPAPPLGSTPADAAEAAAREALAGRLAAADAFVVVTPEYNRSFPAALKELIDAHVTEWQAKPVGFVSYGGISGGLRAVEQLRLVFAELHAVTVRDTVSFHRAKERFDAAGRPTDPDSEVAAKVLLDRLTWWGRVLRDARAEHPYAA